MCLQIICVYAINGNRRATYCKLWRTSEKEQQGLYGWRRGVIGEWMGGGELSL